MCNDILFVFATNIMWEKRHERAWILRQRPGLTGNFCSIKTPCYQNRNSYYKAVLLHVIQASIADGDGHGNILDLSKSVFMTRQGAHRLRDYAGLVKMRLIKHFLPYITASFLFVKNIHAFTSFCDLGTWGATWLHLLVAQRWCHGYKTKLCRVRRRIHNCTNTLCYRYHCHDHTKYRNISWIALFDLITLVNTIPFIHLHIQQNEGISALTISAFAKPQRPLFTKP